jgi:hypothetical protein
MIAELAGAYAAQAYTTAQLVEELRAIASGDLSNATSAATAAVGQVKAYLEWLDDARPEVAPSLDQEDKFALLIDLSRRYSACNAFYLNEADLNSSTLWRWSRGKSRPSKYIATTIVHDIKPIIVVALWELCDKQGLCRKQIPAERHDGDPVLEAAANAFRSLQEKVAGHLPGAARKGTA